MDRDGLGQQGSEGYHGRLIECLCRVNARTPIQIDDIVAKLKEGTAQGFTVGEQSAIVGMMKTDGTVSLYAAAGDIKDLVAFLPTFELWYYYRGGEKVIISGRKGWIRVLKDFGYKLVGEDLEKDLVEWVRAAAATHLPTAT